MVAMSRGLTCRCVPTAVWGMPRVARHLGALIGIPSLGDLPGPLLLVLLPDLGYWLLGFAILLLGSGLFRVARSLAPLVGVRQILRRPFPYRLRPVRACASIARQSFRRRAGR